MTASKRYLEKGIATASFAVAVSLCVVSLYLSPVHDIAANVCLVVAQFLTLTATLLGIDYKFHGIRKNTSGDSQLQPS